MTAGPKDVLRDALLSAGECNSWLTLDEIEKLTGYPSKNILEHLASLRKAGYIVERRLRGYRTWVLEYRLLEKPPDAESHLIPSHGKRGAPCDSPCGHGACAAQLQIAASTCPGCGELIGFDLEYQVYELNAWHVPCLKEFQTPGGTK